MTPLAWSVVSGLFSTGMALVFKGLQRSGGGLRHCYLFIGAVGSVVGWTVLLVQRQPFDALSALFGVAGGLLYLPTAALAFRSLREVPIAIAWTALALGTVVPVAVGLLALGETLSLFKAAGLGLSLATIGLFGLGLRLRHGAAHTRLSAHGLLMCVCMLLLNGLFMVVLKVRERLVGEEHQIEWAAGLYTIVAVVFVGWLLVARPSVRLDGRTAVLGFLYGAASVLGILTVLRAQALPSYVLFPVTNGVQVLGVPVVSFFLFGERLRWPSVLGLVTGLASLVMLGWGSR